MDVLCFQGQLIPITSLYFYRTLIPCHAERRASPGEAGISASRSIPRMSPLPCRCREFSSIHFIFELVLGEEEQVLGRTPWRGMGERKIFGMVRLAHHDKKETVIFK